MYCKTLISPLGTKYFRGPFYYLVFAFHLWHVSVSLYARRTSMVLWLGCWLWIVSRLYQ